MSAAQLARQLKVLTNRITAILNGQRSVTGDTALRLGHFFGTSSEFWMNLQELYELRLAEEKSGETIKDLSTLAKPKKKIGVAHQLYGISLDVPSVNVQRFQCRDGHLCGVLTRLMPPNPSATGRRAVPSTYSFTRRRSSLVIRTSPRWVAETIFTLSSI